MNHWTRAAAAAGLAAAALLGGCKESKLTRDNLAQVKPGMTLTQVEAILGRGELEPTAEGTSISGAGIGSTDGRGKPPKIMVWKEGRTRITVTFQNDKVLDVVPENVD
ncbi:MAG: outer membrane protein assembly factor BamE [Phycisphaeraceae bacterium]|nr:outer membrane protein assembly factor BamE [Phycisphaeraceae bacterium]